MGKASRRRKNASGTTSSRHKAASVPFVARPFEGLTGETDWVALREILPAATAIIRLNDQVGDGPKEATIVTVLPMAWPGLHRSDGTVFVATQSGSSSGDASRDLAGRLLATRENDPGVPLTTSPPITESTPRLQDLLDASAPFDVVVHEGFDFWVGDQDIDDDARESLQRANESIVPMVRMNAVPSAYWVAIADRSFLRVVLPDDEDAATDALARLHGSGDDALGEQTRLLGAFRAGGLLVPVFELDPGRAAADYEDALASWSTRYAAALAESEPLTADQRRARSGLLSRQVTLR